MIVSKKEFVQIIDDNKDRIHHICRVYVDDQERRKDLYQEIIIQVWRSLPTFAGDAKLGTWIYRLAINTAITFIRKVETRKNYHAKYRNERSLEYDISPPVYQKAMGDGQVEQLYEAIRTLNISEKAIIGMYLDDFSYADIAYAMDITENNVGVKLYRIKKKLSEIIDH